MLIYEDKDKLTKALLHQADLALMADYSRINDAAYSQTDRDRKKETKREENKKQNKKEMIDGSPGLIGPLYSIASKML